MANNISQHIMKLNVSKGFESQNNSAKDCSPLQINQNPYYIRVLSVNGDKGEQNIRMILPKFKDIEIYFGCKRYDKE